MADSGASWWNLGQGNTPNALASLTQPTAPQQPNVLAALGTEQMRNAANAFYSGQQSALTGLYAIPPAPNAFNQLLSAQPGTYGATIRNSMPDPTGSYRGSVLPLQVDQDGSYGLAVPGMVKSLLGGAGDLLDGLTTGQVTPEATSALAAALGIRTPAVPEMAETLAASRSVGYNPPVKPPRPFETDYPAGAQADATGRLLTDIEGRSLTAPTVVGRNVVGGGDQAFPSAQLNSLATAVTGGPVEAVAPGALPRGAVGAYRQWQNPATGDIQRGVAVSNKLSPNAALTVGTHEVGHALDEIAGQIPTAGLRSELSTVYNTLNNPQNYGKPWTPQNAGYSGDDVPREMMAEAIRGYMTNPNYLKTVAPKTAAAIRGAINTHPTLSRSIQFNAAGDPIFAGGFIGDGQN